MRLSWLTKVLLARTEFGDKQINGVWSRVGYILQNFAGNMLVSCHNERQKNIGYNISIESAKLCYSSATIVIGQCSYTINTRSFRLAGFFSFHLITISCEKTFRGIRKANISNYLLE